MTSFRIGLGDWWPCHHVTMSCPTLSSVQCPWLRLVHYRYIWLQGAKWPHCHSLFQSSVLMIQYSRVVAKPNANAKRGPIPFSFLSVSTPSLLDTIQWSICLVLSCHVHEDPMLTVDSRFGVTGFTRWGVCGRGTYLLHSKRGRCLQMFFIFRF